MYGKPPSAANWLLQVSTVSLLISSFAVQALPPAWWSAGGSPVLVDKPESNRGAANVGQAKWMALRALDALEDVLGENSGVVQGIRADLLKPSENSPQGIFFPGRPASPSAEWLAAQRAPLQLGALKAIAEPFYRHLSGFDNAWLESQLQANGLVFGESYFLTTGGIFYPWNPANDSETAVNRSVANIGQLKALFSLRLETLASGQSSNPEVDTDGDGMPDEYEFEHGFDPSSPHGLSLDADNDSLTDIEEYRNGTDPRNRDSDYDGMPDGWEVQWGLMPLDSDDAYLDPDGDKVMNLHEYACGGTPTGVYKLEPLLSGVPETHSDPSVGGAGQLVYASNESSFSEPGPEPGFVTDHHSKEYSYLSPPSSTGERTIMSLLALSEVSTHNADNSISEYGGTRPIYYAAADSGGVNAFITRSEGGVVTSYFAPDFTNHPEETNWISFATKVAALKPAVITAEDSLDYESPAVSPSGTQRIHRSTLDEYVVLDESGVFKEKLPAGVSWKAINDRGDAAAITVESIPASGSVPTYQIPWLRVHMAGVAAAEQPAPISLATVPGVTSSAEIRSISMDGLVHVTTSTPVVALSNQFLDLIVHYQSGSIHYPNKPGLGNEPITLLSSENRRMTGTGTEPFHITPDGTCLRLSKLQVHDGSSLANLGALQSGVLTPRHVSSDGRLVISTPATTTEGQFAFFQLTPAQDRDGPDGKGDGLPDDWEKYWAKFLTEMVDSPNLPPGGGLSDGNIDPNWDYQGSGVTPGSIFSEAEEANNRPEDPLEELNKWRVISGGKQWGPGEDESSTETGVWGSGWAYWGIFDASFEDQGFFPYDVATLESILNTEISWDDIRFVPHDFSDQFQYTTYDCRTFVWHDDEDHHALATDISDRKTWIWRPSPFPNPTTRFYVETKTDWPGNSTYNGPGAINSVVGVRFATIEPNKNRSTNSITVETRPNPGGFYQHRWLEPLSAQLKVLKSEVPFHAADGPPSHRKISLFAAPIKDGAPENTAETDTPAEEAYVDAYDRSLKFNTSLAWIPQGSSELPLAVTLSYNPTNLTVLTSERIDPATGRSNGTTETLSPNSELFIGGFGLGFSSNLFGGIKVDAEINADGQGMPGPGNPTGETLQIKNYNIDVIDSDGVPHKFHSADLLGFAPGAAAVPPPPGQMTTLAWESSSHTHLVLTHKFGKKCRYQWQGGAIVPPGTPEGQVTQRGSASLVQVVDSFGNHLDYTAGKISHYHVGSSVASGSILYTAAPNGLIRSITDPRGRTTYFSYVTRSVSGGKFKFPVLSKIVLPDGGVRQFGMTVDYRRPQSSMPEEPPFETDPASIFSYAKSYTSAKKKLLPDEPVESTIAPALSFISDPSGRTTRFTYAEPVGIDSIQRVQLNGTVDFSAYEDYEDSDKLNASEASKIIQAAKLEAGPDIVAEMAARGYNKLPEPPEDDGGMPGPPDPDTEPPVVNGEGLYVRTGLTAAPAVTKVVSSDINGDGLLEEINIEQVDHTLDFLVGPVPSGSAAGLPGSPGEAIGRSPEKIRTTTVTDGFGSTVYDFRDPIILRYANPTQTPSSAADALAPVLRDGPLEPGETPPPEGSDVAAVAVRRLDIDRGGARETYYFEPKAGMALAAAIDASGNTTAYTYSDPIPGGTGGRPVPGGGIQQLQEYYGDPTTEAHYPGNVLAGGTATGGVSRTLKYDSRRRLQTEVIDERGFLTQQTLDTAGKLRVSESVFAGATSGGAKVRDESWSYGDSRFPSFVTEHRIKAITGAGDQAWVGDMVTTFEADDKGRVWKEKVLMPGSTPAELVTTYTYDANGNKTMVTTPRGLTTAFIYDSMGRIQKTIYPDLEEKEFQYDKAGRKTAEIDENDTATTFKYSPGGLPIETRRHMAADVADTPDDLVTKTAYDSRGRAISVTDPNGNRTTKEYDALDRVISVTDAALGVSRFHYDLTKNAGGGVFKGSSFKPTRTLDVRGYITEATFDYRYLPVTVAKEYVLGTGPDWTTRALAATAVTQTIYDAAGNATDTYVKRQAGAALTSADVLHTNVEFDALNRATLTTVEKNQSLEHKTETLFTSTGLAWKTLEFKDISALQRAYESEYDAAGRVVREWSPPAESTTGEVNKTVSSLPTSSAMVETRYDADGNVKEKVDPLGRVTTYHYDVRNRQEKTELPAVANYDAGAAMVRPTTVIKFDKVGNQVKTTDPRGVVTEVEYDRAYRTTCVTAAVGEPEETKTFTFYDKNGNVILVTDPNGNKTRNAYDSLNRLIGTSVNPSTGNPGDPFSPVTGDIVVANTYDAAGNLILVADGEATKSWDTSITPNAWSFLPAGQGHLTQFAYDGLNRKTYTIWDAGSSLAKSEQMVYDAVVQVERIDAQNRHTTYLYDSLFRLTTTSYGVTGGPSEDCARYYAGGASTAVSGPGPLHAVWYGDGTDLRDVTYQLDRLGRTVAETSAGATHLYAYDKVGNRLMARYFNRRSLSGVPAVQIRALASEYDALNRVTKIHDTTRTGISDHAFVVNTSTDRTTLYAYDLSGNVRSKVLPNGQRTITSYDGLGRKTDILTKDRSDQWISHFIYAEPADPGTPGVPGDPGYDKVGNIRYVQEFYSNLSERTVINDYDHTYRLSREVRDDNSGVVTTDYEYDKANNRTLKAVTGGDEPGVWGFTYGNITNGRNTNQLVSYFRPSDAATLAFTYDASGNRATRTKNGDPDALYAYDRENRLVHYETYDALGRDDGYSYDYRSRRVWREENDLGPLPNFGVELSFSGGTSVQEYDPGYASPNAEHIRGSDWGGGVGGILYTHRGGDASFCAYNSRGDVVSRTDSSGDVTWQGAYEAFGKRTESFGTTTERQTANTKDEDLSGLLNEGMRYRDLEAGMFIMRDPAGFVNGPNVYTYVRQNPWTMFDPFGLWTTSGVPDDPDEAEEVEAEIADTHESIEDLEIKIEEHDSPEYEGLARGQIDKLSARSLELKTKLEVYKIVSEEQAGYIIGPRPKRRADAMFLFGRDLGNNPAFDQYSHIDPSITDPTLDILSAIEGGFALKAVGSNMLKWASIRGVAKAANTAERQVLYHYTNEAGHAGILESQQLNPSLKALSPKDVRYGNGQYLSDIAPGTKTPAQLSREFLNQPFQGQKYTHYIEIDATGLGAVEGRPGVWVVPNETPLDLTGRIISSGAH